MNSKTLNLEKFFFVYEAMLLLEETNGKYLRINDLEKKVTSIVRLNKSLQGKIKISKREFNQILQFLLASGIIFFPLGGIVQRMVTFRWKDVKERDRIFSKALKKFREEYEKRKLNTR